MPSCQHLQRTYCTPAIVYDCALFQVSFFNLVLIEKSWKRCFASMMLFIIMIHMAAVPIIMLIIVIVAVQIFNSSLILPEEEIILHEGRGRRPCYILSHMNLDGQHQDHTILVIFHLLILTVIIFTKTTILAIDSK